MECIECEGLLEFFKRNSILIVSYLRYLKILIPSFILFLFMGQVSEINKHSQKNNFHLYKNSIFVKPVRVNNTDEYGEKYFNAFFGSEYTNSGYIAVPDSSGFYNLSSKGTIEAWIMPVDTANIEQTVVAKCDSVNTGFCFYLTAAGKKLGFRIGNFSSVNSSGTDIPLNQWTHAAVTWSRQSSNFKISFFINGAESGMPEINAGTFNLSSDSLMIGGSGASLSSKNFIGYIDEVKIWNIERTQTQIAQNRFVGLGDYSLLNKENAITSAVNYSGLISSWTFNLNTRDDISGENGYLRQRAGYYSFPYTAGFPIPYNFALYCQGSDNSFVTVPYSPAFNLNNSGTVEAWVYPLTQTTTHVIVSIGTSGFEFFWGIRKGLGNKQVLTIGSVQFTNTDGIVIPANKWTHIAVSWISGGGSYTVTFYVNGVQSGTHLTRGATWTANSGTLRIAGWQGGAGNKFSGYIDELKFWSKNRTDPEIKYFMFVSCRSILYNENLVAAWNFDGNLKNFSSIYGLDGSFNTGGINNCYISAYLNESTTGPVPDNQFIAFPTVLSSEGFPNGFVTRVLNMQIQVSATIKDTLKVNFIPGNLNSLQVFLSIQNQIASDLKIKLKAPNNTEVILSDALGGYSQNGYLTIVNDSIGNLITSSVFLSPWTNCVRPQNPLGTLSNTTLNGSWILTITNGYTDYPGTFLGWGLRFNNFTNYDSISIMNYVPDNYSLFQNYPNPFNPVTKIKFQIPSDVRSQKSKVKIIIYDVLGKEILTLVNGELQPGSYEVTFDGSNYASGIYFYQLRSGDYINTRKMILLK